MSINIINVETVLNILNPDNWVSYSMKDHFQFDNYKELIAVRLCTLPKKGRGESARIARHLRMHTTRVSHIFSGSEHLTLEQASSLAVFFGFSSLESDYFVTLVALQRAGNEDLKRVLTRQRDQIRERSRQLSQRLPTDRIFTDIEKAVFYSNWYYSAIRLLTSIDGFDGIDPIARRLNLPRYVVKQVLDFLVSAGLCEERSGRYKMGPTKTHLEAEHPMATRLHANWRLKAIERHPRLESIELAFTAPMSVREKDLPRIREMIVQFIEQTLKIPASCEKPEKLACLTIDWFLF